MLSSDVLEKQFGPTVLDVLFGGEDEMERVIRTRVLFTKKVLELSRVQFDTTGVEAFPAVHREVVNGVSMGVAFRNAGVTFTPERLLIGRTRPPRVIRNQFGSCDPATLIAATIVVGDKKIPYCGITEMYSPVVDCNELLT